MDLTLLCLDWTSEMQKEIPNEFKTGRSPKKGMVTAVGTFLAIAVFRREVGNWNWAPAAFQSQCKCHPAR